MRTVATPRSTRRGSGASSQDPSSGSSFSSLAGQVPPSHHKRSLQLPPYDYQQTECSGPPLDPSVTASTEEHILPPYKISVNSDARLYMDLNSAAAAAAAPTPPATRIPPPKLKPPLSPLKFNWRLGSPRTVERRKEKIRQMMENDFEENLFHVKNLTAKKCVKFFGTPHIPLDKLPPLDPTSLPLTNAAAESAAVRAPIHKTSNGSTAPSADDKNNNNSKGRRPSPAGVESRGLCLGCNYPIEAHQEAADQVSIRPWTRDTLRWRGESSTTYLLHSIHLLQ